MNAHNAEVLPLADVVDRAHCESCDHAAGEHWRPVAGIENRYEVSCRGRVRRRYLELAVPRQSSPKPARVVLPELVLRGTLQKGYVWHGLGRGGSTRRAAHRLIAEAFIGPRPPGQVVRHLDGNKLNNAVENLAYGSVAENIGDQIVQGRHVSGNKSSCHRGHLLAGPNLRMREGGRQRECVSCARARTRVYRARREGRPVPDLTATAQWFFDQFVGDGSAGWLDHAEAVVVKASDGVGWIAKCACGLFVRAASSEVATTEVRTHRCGDRSRPSSSVPFVLGQRMWVAKCPDCSFAVRWPTRDEAERSAAEHREAAGG